MLRCNGIADEGALQISDSFSSVLSTAANLQLLSSSQSPHCLVVDCSESQREHRFKSHLILVNFF